MQTIVPVTAGAIAGMAIIYYYTRKDGPTKPKDGTFTPLDIPEFYQLKYGGLSGNACSDKMWACFAKQTEAACMQGDVYDQTRMGVCCPAGGHIIPIYTVRGWSNVLTGLQCGENSGHVYGDVQWTGCCK